ncbi:MAG: hypothetical protein KAS86_00570 [Candidatus Omnitrophica bacterium]|nr:hypothetical protein [Candidatus Omnitrophota bacterium]
MKDKLRKIVENKLARDILAFFHMNQGSIDTVSGVSAWVREDKKKTEAVLDSLVKAGMLEQNSSGSTKGYCYTRDRKAMKIIKEIIEGNG